MKNGKWKRFISERTVLTVLLMSLVLLTMITVAVIVNHQKKPDTSILVKKQEETHEVAEESAAADENSYAEELAELPDESEDAAAANAGAEAESTLSGETEAAVAEQTQAAEPAAAVGNALAFSEESQLTWPVEGEILREFAMDHTTWYATLEQYRTSPAVLIQSEVGTPVLAPANCQVTAIGYNEEIGNYVVIDMGSEYSALIGLLDQLCVAEGQYLSAGTQLASVANPTIYYTVEGPSIYFEVLNGTQPSDPLTYLN